MPNASSAAPPHQVPAHSLEVRRLIHAPQRRVFEAWTNPEDLTRWHAPGPVVVEHAEVELRVGGAYRVHMRSPDGKEHHAYGIYREVDPPRKLVYTWSWVQEPEVKDSIITIEFLARGPNETEVVLRHDGLPGEKQASSHREGWSSILDKLAARFEA